MNQIEVKDYRKEDVLNRVDRLMRGTEEEND